MGLSLMDMLKHNRSDMVAVLRPYEALPYYIHIYIPMDMLGFRQVYVSHIEHDTENFSFCTTHKSSVSTGFTKQITPMLRILCYNGSLVTWTVVRLTTTKSLISSMFVFVLCYTANIACCLHNLLFNYIHVEAWKLSAYHGPVCTLENFQYYGEPCFARAAILR
jgi:hypothetical protein